MGKIRQNCPNKQNRKVLDNPQKYPRVFSSPVAVDANEDAIDAKFMSFRLKKTYKG
ncbi:hypothetical protein P3L10_028021 [Capsicum annuum]